MAWIRNEYVFPCGLKIYIESQGLMLKSNFELKDIICPIHGKNCTKKLGII